MNNLKHIKKKTKEWDSTKKHLETFDLQLIEEKIRTIVTSKDA